VRNLPGDATAEERFAAHFVLARCLAEKYDTKKAIEHFRAAVALTGHGPEAEDLTQTTLLKAPVAAPGEPLATEWTDARDLLENSSQR
jgi:hypothetical protein